MSSKNKSGRARPQDFQKKKVSTAASWGAKRSATTELELPSGHVVLIKRVDLPTLLASGAFPDELMAIVSDKIGSATGKADSPKEVDPAVVEDMTKDPKKLASLFDAIDKIVPMVVQEPTVLFHKKLVLDDAKVPVVPEQWEVIPEDDRDEDILYTDVVDLEDKMHIFQFTVGGTREVSDFRTQLSSAVADVPAN